MIITFLDLETTDKDPGLAEILTSYCVTINVITGEIVDEQYLTYKPDRYRHDSFEIHGISEAEAMGFDNKWDSFLSLLRYLGKYKDGLYCCHANYAMFGVHGYFDRQVIKQICYDRKHETYIWFERNIKNAQFISTHTMAKRLLGLKKAKLSDVAEHFGLKNKKAHDAKADTEIMVEIFQKLQKQFGLYTEKSLLNSGSGFHEYKPVEGEIFNGSRPS